MDWNDEEYEAFDFETSGTLPEYALQAWRIPQGLAWATSLVHLRRSNGKTIVRGGVEPTVDQMVEMLEDAIKNKRRLVGWFVNFDIGILLAYGLEELVFKCKWLDGMRLWKHAFIEPEYEMQARTKKSYGLKSCVAELWPEHAGYAKGVEFHDDSPASRAILHQYNIKDCVFTLKATRHWWEHLTNQQQKVALIEAECLPLVARANLHGMPVDTLVGHELQQKLVDDAQNRIDLLAPLGVTEKIVRSPVQLASLLFDNWGLQPIKFNTSRLTQNKTRSTDKEVLFELSFGDPRIKCLREYREALNNKTKFADAPLKSAEYNGDGRTRPQAIVFGAYSGRMTYASSQDGFGPGKRDATVKKVKLPTGFALHQMKRDKAFRCLVVAPPGYGIVEFDASGQEFRWMAEASRDQTMIALCEPGEDAHTFMGARIEGLDYEETMTRYKAGEEAVAGPQGLRMFGKLSNLCVAEKTLVLTDRGVCNIEQVRRSDLVWDGVEFVRHAGVICSGTKAVVSYAGLTATPTHEVSVNGTWTALEDAARYGWTIESALGAGWPHQVRSAIRIMGGLVRRAVREIWRSLCTSALRLWSRARWQSAISRDGALVRVPSLRYSSDARGKRAADTFECGRQTNPETCRRMVSTLQQSEGQILPQLRRAWDRVPVCLGQRGGRVHQDPSSTSNLLETGHRPSRQRWSLRAWKLALGYAQAELGELATARVYDLTDCGPRHQFAANGLIVHNSLQYRTSAPRLRMVGRVDYGLQIDILKSERIHRTYRNTYVGVPKYWNHQIDLTKRNQYVETLAGRRVHVVGDWTGNFGWSMASTAINYRIQGTGADQKYLALAVLRPYLETVGAYFAWDLHDGIYSFVPERKLEKVASEGKRLLDNLPYKQAWNMTPSVPMPWDAKFGFSWGTLQEFKP